MLDANFEEMNETDVREVIVRPLLHRLGFKHGTQANIRTEVVLKYDRAFLGRKNPAKDPPLTGRADYVCEAISYGRWVVEVKAPSQALTQDDAEQAHTYAAHPGVSALYFLLTNGRHFKLYMTGQLETPALEWAYEETNERIPTLLNIVGYGALKKRMSVIKPDTGKPLGFGLPSKIRIIGGEVRYGNHKSSHPLFRMDAMKGKVGQIAGGEIGRAVDGRLFAVVALRSPYQQFAELNKLAGLGDPEFFCAEEFISADPSKPTIFQNVVQASLQPGVIAELMPGLRLPMPIGFDCAVFTEATGYTEDETFKGVLTFQYDYKIIPGRPTGNPQVDHLIRSSPETATIQGVAEFVINWAPFK